MNENEEKKTVTIDLRHVMCEVNIGEYRQMDLSKEVGNMVHQATSDIGIDEKARELYHNGRIECDEATAQFIKNVMNNDKVLLFARQAIIKEIDKALNV